VTTSETLRAPPRPVRSVALAVASVSCSNSACMGVHRRATHIVPVVHQHGCSQVEVDLDLTREILAGLVAHPNVARSVIVGLGCEANQPDALAARARTRGARVAVVGIQESGGLQHAIEAALASLDVPVPGERSGAPVAGPALVGVLADEASGEPGARTAGLIADQLAACGSRVVTSVVTPPPSAAAPIHGANAGVPAVWRRGERAPHDAVASLARREDAEFAVRAGVTDVERLTALAVCGAEVTVVVTASASPIGSPVAPTIKVSCSAEIDALDDVVDVPYLGGADVAERTADVVAEVIAGRRTNAERWGARDIAVWRIAPYF
jgi:altronate dehydratase large subunit